MARFLSENSKLFVKNHRLFANLPEDDLNEILNSIWEFDVVSGGQIVSEGEHTLSAYVILEGRVKVFSEKHQDNNDMLTTLSVGDYLGEMEFLNSPPSPRYATAVAIDKVKLLEIPSELLTKFPEVKKRLTNNSLVSNNITKLEICDVQPLENDFYIVQLTAQDGYLPAFEPGQHVNLMVKAGDEWLHRNYFPIRKIDNTTWEFMVYQEPSNLISNLLTSKHYRGELEIKATDPQGTFIIKPELSPIIFFASGIGIAPALAAIVAKIPNFYLHYSFDPKQKYTDQTWVKVGENITFHEGKVSLEDIKSYLDSHPFKTIYVCGSEDFTQLFYDAFAILKIHPNQTKFFSLESSVSSQPKKSACPFHNVIAHFSRKKASEIELFLNDVENQLGGSKQQFDLRISAIKDEVGKLGFFIPTTDEIKAGIKQIFINHKISLEHLYILDRRKSYAARTPQEIQQILKEHEMLVSASSENSVITVLPEHIDLPDNTLKSWIELTNYCRVPAIISLAKKLSLELPLRYKHVKGVEALKIPRPHLDRHKTPIIGYIKRLKELTINPLEVIKALSVEKGQPYVLQARSTVDLYILGPTPYHDFLNMPAEIGRRGGIMMTVPAVGFWYHRSNMHSEPWMQSLLLGTRAFIGEHLVGPNQIGKMPPIIRDVVQKHVAKMKDKIDLNATLIPLVHDASVSAIVQRDLWDAVKDKVIPLVRIIVDSIDTQRSAVAQYPLTKFLLREYYATKKLQRILDRVVANHRAGIKKYAYLDFLAEAMIDGKPLPKEDLSWFLMYVIWNAVSYAGTYSVWTIAKILSTPGVYEDIKSRNENDRKIFLNHCFIETMRVFPVTILARVLGCPVDIQIKNKTYTMPKGAWGSVTPIDMTRDPELYPDPETWNPYRYENGAKVPEAFGSGPFSCVAVRYNHLYFSTLLNEIFTLLDLKLIQPNVKWPPCRVHPIYPSEPIWVEVKKVNQK